MVKIVQPDSRVLELGPGCSPMPGAFGVDINEGADRQMAHDLNVIPWPLREGHFYVVHAYQILEHLENKIAAMEEIWRVCAHGAVVNITIPRGYCEGFAQNPQHVPPAWNEGSFGHFAIDEQYQVLYKDEPRFTHARFRLLRYWGAAQARKLYWGEMVPKDELWVTMIVVKEAEGED